MKFIFDRIFFFFFFGFAHSGEILFFCLFSLSLSLSSYKYLHVNIALKFKFKFKLKIHRKLSNLRKHKRLEIGLNELPHIIPFAVICYCASNRINIASRVKSASAIISQDVIILTTTAQQFALKCTIQRI